MIEAIAGEKIEVGQAVYIREDGLARLCEHKAGIDGIAGEDMRPGHAIAYGSDGTIVIARAGDSPIAVALTDIPKGGTVKVRADGSGNATSKVSGGCVVTHTLPHEADTPLVVEKP